VPPVARVPPVAVVPPVPVLPPVPPPPLPPPPFELLQPAAAARASSTAPPSRAGPFRMGPSSLLHWGVSSLIWRLRPAATEPTCHSRSPLVRNPAGDESITSSHSSRQSRSDETKRYLD